MRDILYSVFITIIVISSKVRCDEISSKLDFGKTNEKYVIQPEGDTIEDSATTLVCINGGCNKTQSKTDELLTDIVVHVKTSQKGAKSSVSNKTIDDSPDIPVVVGSSSSPTTILSENYLNSNAATNYEKAAKENLFIPSLPTYHTRYHGEQQPQHFVWYPKGGSAYNPVEFKKFERPTWRRVQYPQQFQHRVSPGYTTCTCQNPGLNWYPTTPTFNYHYRKNDGIDDKLADLN